MASLKKFIPIAAIETAVIAIGGKNTIVITIETAVKVRIANEMV